MRVGHVGTISHEFVGGWVADTADPSKRLDVTISVNNVAVARIKADLFRKDLAARASLGDGHHGFRHVFEPKLDPAGTYVVRVFFSDTNVLIAEGERLLAPGGNAADGVYNDETAANAANLAPILISGTGRSGTTMLMAMLAGADGIIAAELIPYETRLLSFYANAWRVLTHPADIERSTHHDRVHGDGFSIGFNPYNSPAFHAAFAEPAPLYDYTNRFVGQRLQSAFADIISEYYRRLAADKKKPGVVYFAEKNNNVQGVVRGFARSAFGPVKEIVTLRDPRDIFCSQMAWFKLDPEQLYAHISHALKMTLLFYKKNEADVYFSSYERMLAGDKASLAALSAFLNIDIRPVNRAKNEIAFRKHATSADATASIGRWRKDLPSAWRARCDHDWREYIETFGY